MNNKELINAGHELAKAISNDTPLIEIAKMVSNLATQLDVQIARSNQLSIALKAAEKRIAELEAREVKLPAEKFCPAEYAGSQLWEETEIWNKAVQSCEDAIRTEGIKVAAAGKGE